jgi:SAM-dependent methyltransferase
MSARDPIALWDAEAASFDEAADHGLRDPTVRDAWRELLLPLLPGTPGLVADLGCGTGTLSLLLADAGYTVNGVDFSPEMVRLARAKAATHRAGDEVTFTRADASAPPLTPGQYAAVLCRHVLWALPDPAAALARWIDLLQPGGSLVLVEGSWSTGAGLTAAQTVDLVQTTGRRAELRMLPEAAYWGREIDDERYLVVSR